MFHKIYEVNLNNSERLLKVWIHLLSWKLAIQPKFYYIDFCTNSCDGNRVTPLRQGNHLLLTASKSYKTKTNHGSESKGNTQKYESKLENIMCKTFIHLTTLLHCKHHFWCASNTDPTSSQKWVDLMMDKIIIAKSWPPSDLSTD